MRAIVLQILAAALLYGQPGVAAADEARLRALEETVAALQGTVQSLQAKNDVLELAVQALRWTAAVSPRGDVRGRRLDEATSGTILWDDDHFELTGGDVHVTDGKIYDIDGILNGSVATEAFHFFNDNVMFHALKTELQKDVAEDDLVVFQSAVLNVGNSYDAATSTFTAPYHGLYRFDFQLAFSFQRTSTCIGYKLGTLDMRINGVSAGIAAAQVITGENSGAEYYGSGFAYVELSQADQVTIGVAYASSTSSWCDNGLALGDQYASTDTNTQMAPHANYFAGALIARLSG